MNDTDREVLRQAHLAQAQELNGQGVLAYRRKRNLAQRVKDELSFRLEIGDLDTNRDCCDWIAHEHPEALTQIMCPGECSHKEVIDRWRTRWIDEVIASEGWLALDTQYQLGVE
jgi:hypothetical protein